MLYAFQALNFIENKNLSLNKDLKWKKYVLYYVVLKGAQYDNGIMESFR